MTPVTLPAAALDWLARADRQPLIAVDSHTAGNPTRIVLSGLDLPEDVTGVDAARLWLRDNADQWRRRLVHEPRGGGLTCAVLPIATTEDGCDIGAVILEPGSYPPMCGHCMIGFATVIGELDLLPDLWRADPLAAQIRIRTPAGPIGARITREAVGGALTVTLANVQSFTALRRDCEVDGRVMPVELLYGGDYYMSVDAKAIGLSLDRSNATEITRIARLLSAAFNAEAPVDPHTGAALDVYQALFYDYDPATPDHAKIVVVAPPGVIDRSPCGTGSSAFHAKLVTEGYLAPEAVLHTESIIGTRFRVTSGGLAKDGARLLVSPLLTGQAFINGFLTIAVDGADALADGFDPL
ncbi:proline racemase family protein [Pararhodobacter sp. CCB-MM2]|uniref:proline racemase family protein n=1 Tax=Pararhodobacter sp. CCB-MM2 TaxID=1786003 RepID=UPI00082F495E|nr:proline racemase family protein [Pararhodobacter sp. CCB-MM2]